MKMQQFILSASLVLLVGCSMREEGPAERIGRGLDEVMRGAQDLSEQSAKSTRETEEEELRKRRRDDTYQQDRYQQDRYRDYDRYEDPSDEYRYPPPRDRY